MSTSTKTSYVIKRTCAHQYFGGDKTSNGAPWVKTSEFATRFVNLVAAKAALGRTTTLGAYDVAGVVKLTETSVTTVTTKEEAQNVGHIARKPKDLRSTDVDSSFINRIGYSPSLKMLVVTMTDATFEYDDVPANFALDMLLSDSKGVFYNEFIKPYNKGVKIS